MKLTRPPPCLSEASTDEPPHPRCRLVNPGRKSGGRAHHPFCTLSSDNVLLFFLIFIGVQLMYNVLISGVQQSESVIHIHTYTLFLRLFSHIGRYRVLSRVPCVIQ